MTKKHPAKIIDLMAAVRLAVETGNYRDTRHAVERQDQRAITRPEISYVLLHGHHEKAKDAYRDAFETWSYAVRGKTVDSRELRIVLAFDEAGMLIITAIDLDL